IAQALSNFLVISPANPARAETRAVAKDGWSALPGGEAKRLGLEADLGKANADALATEIAEGHCGLLPASSLPAMSRVQRLRDARMADALLVAGEWKGGILIAGNGHVRRDRAVPWYMQERGIADGEITAVMHVEVSEGETDPTAYLGKLGGEGPVADFVVFTPRTERPDPCETMREHMSKMKKQG
ncbi:MAG: ChaN family lipoprotein, partial [Hyphomicrobiaceae bacterium]